MDIDPTLLRAFVAVSETGGFTRAARRLSITQPAVSHQIRRLEEQVGRVLIRRTTRRLTLTHDGEDFLLHARQILTGLDALAQRFRPSPVTGVVRFGAPEAFMGERLPALLCQFSRAFPAVRLDVHVSSYLDISTMIAAEELDLAVVLSTAGGENGGIRLRRADFAWVAADNFLLPEGASLPLAFHPPNCINRLVGVAALEATSIDWHIAFTSPSEQGLRAAVRSGLAVAVLIRSDVEPGLRVLDGNYGLPALPGADFMLIRRGGPASPAALAFGQMLVAMEAPAGSAETGI
ncbi:LysR family transcriptional regulator [Sphingopyxis sp. Root214]|uniref:LysR family transcriptional regulator n=1 Tax=unclassified Sphingopyxis TaxID=2614943 RepID=UPI0006F66753|nr:MULTISPECIES: LysR family transcriptional regulator [unclassified Sphingopyxis]KQZ69551.1 LysR family transcriptional regulator [Sphingopyxis sp. Root154]KRC10951.1 LysR family transcriptional regulator [Sphingopyxis sp. Root214]